MSDSGKLRRRMGQLDRIAPGSRTSDAGYRLLMGAAAARLVAARGPAPRAVARALATTASDRIPAAERAWLDRIDAHRRLLPSIAVEHSLDPRGLEAGVWLSEAKAATGWMSLPPAIGRLLLRLVRELRPSSCLELGTGFGVSATYQAAGLELNGSGSLVSLDVEGMTVMAEPALARLGLGERVELVSGQIEETLAGALERARPVDLALLDADHTYEGTVAAFDAIGPALAPGAVVVLDDIHWTDEMRDAWADVRGRPAVEASVSLRRLGIVTTGAQ